MRALLLLCHSHINLKVRARKKCEAKMTEKDKRTKSLEFRFQIHNTFIVGEETSVQKARRILRFETNI